MCGPSRASMFTGVYPHISSHLWQYNWKNNEVLKNTKTIMEKFKENDYNVIGSGKLLHQNEKSILKNRDVIESLNSYVEEFLDL